jgi:hypothetical protein
MSVWALILEPKNINAVPSNSNLIGIFKSGFYWLYQSQQKTRMTLAGSEFSLRLVFSLTTCRRMRIYPHLWVFGKCRSRG